MGLFVRKFGVKRVVNKDCDWRGHLERAFLFKLTDVRRHGRTLVKGATSC